MDSEGISSLAVVDNAMNVIGNISTVDVKLLTKTSSLPLLRSSCIHFISIILSTRGMNEGKDSFPVFYVNPLSTLAHTIAKLMATNSHRYVLNLSLWPLPFHPVVKADFYLQQNVGNRTVTLPSKLRSTDSLSPCHRTTLVLLPRLNSQPKQSRLNQRPNLRPTSPRDSPNRTSAASVQPAPANLHSLSICLLRLCRLHARLSHLRSLVGRCILDRHPELVRSSDRTESDRSGGDTQS